MIGIRDRQKFLVLTAPTVLALWFLNTFAFRYLSADPSRLGIFLPRRQWLYVHVVFGAIALLAGPIQLWIGLNRKHKRFHRWLGVTYVISVVASCTAAFYLAFHTDYGWVFAMGLVSMGLAWLISTGLAIFAIYKRLIDHHREWMIRSYVVTFSFVTFRIVLIVLNIVNVGTTLEQLTAAAWVSWSVPLMLTEAILQGRKILAAYRVPKAKPVYLLTTSLIDNANESAPDLTVTVAGS
jgi:hypothetical protein